MVPLGGLPGHRANGQPYLSGTNGRTCTNGVHVNRGCPATALGYAGMKPQQHCPGELQQVTQSRVYGQVQAGRCGGSGWAAFWGFLPSSL